MDVSVLIPLFNRLELTRACLESLERTVRRVRYEVILVDDGSTDGTRDFLRTLPAPRYRVVLNEQPRGYAFNNNAAARLARADTLCLLNNDTVLLPGWLEPMLRLLRRVPYAGCVGNVQREPISGLIDHIGVTFNAEGIPIHAGKDDATPPTEPFSRWPAVTAACCVVRQTVFRRVGGFDEQFRNGFEDVDFCLRAAEMGYGHYVANRSIIYHYVSSSPGRHRFEEENLRIYRQRWADRITAYRQRRAALTSRDRNTPFTHDDELAWHRHWGMAREARRQYRQDLIDARQDGRRYLRKHVLRPWRYGFRRLCNAIVKATHPLPAPLLPHLPHLHFDAAAPGGQQPPPVNDELLFDPPQQP
jgi:GT2 family glycosyltransferase